MNIVELFILDKRSDEFELEMNRVKAKAEENNGNIIMYHIFLLRSLAQLFRNKPEKVIFVDRFDDKKNGPDDNSPNIFITRQNTFGEAEFEEKIIINLRIGDKLIGKDLSLPEALAGLIQVFFCFNLMYMPEVDDVLQFIERILCSFGNSDGARNKRNAVKKGYRDFEVKGHILSHFNPFSFNSGVCSKLASWCKRRRADVSLHPLRIFFGIIGSFKSLTQWLKF